MKEPTKDYYSKLKVFHHPNVIESLQVGGIPAPRQVQVDLVNNCTHRCVFCFYTDEFKGELANNKLDIFDPKASIPTTKMFELIDDLARIGVGAVSYSIQGDEPIIVKDKVDGLVKTFTIRDFCDIFEKGRYSTICETDTGKITEKDINNICRHSSGGKLLKVVTEGNFNLTMTPNHSAMVYDPQEKQVINKVASNLELGDSFLLANKFMESTHENVLHIDKSFRIHSGHGTPLQEKVVLNDKFSRLLGYFVAEGNYVPYGVNFTFGYNERAMNVINDVKEILDSFGWKYSVYKRYHKNSVLIHGNWIRHLFEDVLGIKGGAHNKNVPSILLGNKDLSLIENFVAGYLLGDGAIRFRPKHGSLEVSSKTVSNQLAFELIILYRRLGFNPRYYYGTAKERYIEGRLLKQSNYHMITCNGIGILDTGVFKKFSSISGLTFTYKKSKFAYRLGKNANVYLKDTILAKIKSIEEISSEEEVYDLEIDGIHNFFSGIGVVETHNTGGGEPTLHPDFDKIIERTNRRGIKWSLTTNGSLIHKKRLSYLLTTATWVRFSMDAATEDIFNACQRPMDHSDYGYLLTTITNLCRKRNRPLVGLSFVVNSINHQEVYDFVKLGKKLGVDNVRISLAYTSEMSKMHEPYIKQVTEDVNRAITEFESDKFKVFAMLERYEDLKNPEKKYKNCYFHNFTCAVSADQNVHPCCTTKGRKNFIIGSLNEKSFSDIWFGDDHRNFVKNLNVKSCPACWFDGQNEIIERLVKKGIASETKKLNAYGKKYVETPKHLIPHVDWV